MLVTAELLCSAIVALNIGGSSERSEYACTHAQQVIEISEEMGFRPELLVSLIHHESMWDPAAVSAGNACGLTQILPKYTGDSSYPGGTGNLKLTCEQLKEPSVSIDAGARSLRYWIHRYGKGQEKTGLCGYNKGFRCTQLDSYVEVEGMGYATKVVRTANKIHTHMMKQHAFDKPAGPACNSEPIRF